MRARLPAVTLRDADARAALARGGWGRVCGVPVCGDVALPGVA